MFGEISPLPGFQDPHQDDIPTRIGYVVDNHGDRCCPLSGSGNVGPRTQMADIFMAKINGGDPKYLLNGMIL